MNSFLKFVVDNYIVDFAMISLGFFAMVLIVERVKYLYFDASLNVQTFMEQVRSSIRADKVEDAITFCAGNTKSPVAHVIKALLEKSELEDKDMEQAIDVSVSEVMPNLSKGLSYLSMISNVVTLFGLFGTILGLILAFQAVSFADPSQKQLLLAQGISVAMTSTALGLGIAIPVMVVYSFLHTRQGRIFEQIAECSGKTLELLRTRWTQPANEKTAFPDTVSAGTSLAKNAPPVPTTKPRARAS